MPQRRRNSRRCVALTFRPHSTAFPAHISLFHQLPGSEFDAVVARVRLTASEHRAPIVTAIGLRSLGRGVAVQLRSPRLAALHDDLAAAWQPLLIPQDRHRFAGHVTIQNKVAPARARATLAALTTTFVPFDFHIVAVDIWRYLDGPWEALQSVTLRP